MGLINVTLGGLFGGGAVVPALGASVAAGVRFRAGIGIVGVLHARWTLASGGSVQLYGLGPGVRFGNRTQLTLAVTPTLGLVKVGAIQTVGVITSLLAQVAIVLGDTFSLCFQPSLDFDPSGLIGSLTGGLGLTF